MLLLALALFAGIAPLSAQDPTTQSCSTPALAVGGELGSPVAITDTITIATTTPIVDVQIALDVTHSFVGDLVIDIEHVGTTARLLEAFGGSGPGVLARFDDRGLALGSEPLTCDCRFSPWIPDTLSALASPVADGDWTITLEDIFPASADGELQEWCVNLFENTPPAATVPLQNLFCNSVPGSGTAQVGWTSSTSYDNFEVFIDGVWVALLAGSDSTYTSPPLPVPSLVTVDVRGITSGQASPFRRCVIGLEPAIDLEICETPQAVVSSTALPVIDTVTLTDTFPIGDLQVSVDLNHTWVGDLEVSLTSPTVTTVLLHNHQGGDGQDLRLTYWQFGVANGSAPYNCDCFMEPSGPGSLLDFLDIIVAGNWTFSVTDTFAGDSGILNSWCLRFFEQQPVFAVQGLLCAPTPIPGQVLVNWENPIGYDRVDVFVDGQLAQSVSVGIGAGSVTSVLLNAASSPQQAEICVIPERAGESGPARCCVVDLQLPAVQALTVTADVGSNFVTATWNNPMTYDFLEVTVNGSAPVQLPPSATSYGTPILASPELVEVCVVGTLNSFGASPVVCDSVFVLDPTLFSQCSEPMLPIDNTLGATTDTLSIADNSALLDLEISLEVTHTFVGDLIIDLTAPNATTVRLQELGGAGADDVRLIYSDNGQPQGSISYNCGCRVIPEQPLSQLVPQAIAGDWTLTVTDVVDFDSGILERWCVRALDLCSFLPPTGLSGVAQQGDVILSWSLSDVYDEIDIVRDDTTIATVSGLTTSYVDTAVGGGVHLYQVTARRNNATCVASSSPIEVAFDISDIVFAGEGAGLVDSVAALHSSLQALGHTPHTVTTLDAAMLDPADSNVEAIWVQLGTFPDNHSLSSAEGLVLAEFHTGDFGLDGTADRFPLPIYIEGADVWGFDAPTPFSDYDGVDGSQVEDGDDTLVSLRGLDSGLGLELGDGTWNSAYDQDQITSDFTDKLVAATDLPDLGGDQVAAIWDHPDDSAPYLVGVFYASNIAPVISQSFEFGGYVGDRMALANAYRTAMIEGVPISPADDPFRRGDVIPDGQLQITDVLSILGFLFLGNASPTCQDAVDIDDNGQLGIPDVIALLNYLFVFGSAPPAAPGGIQCGLDPTPDLLPTCIFPGCP